MCLLFFSSIQITGHYLVDAKEKCPPDQILALQLDGRKVEGVSRTLANLRLKAADDRSLKKVIGALETFCEQCSLHQRLANDTQVQIMSDESLITLVADVSMVTPNMPKNVVQSLKTRCINNLLAEFQWTVLTELANPGADVTTLNPLKVALKHGCTNDNEWILEIENFIIAGMLVQMVELGTDAFPTINEMWTHFVEMFNNVDPIDNSVEIVRAIKHFKVLFDFAKLCTGARISKDFVVP